MRRLITLLLLAGLAGTVIAALPYGESKVTADGNVDITGASSVELLTDGTATATIRRYDARGDSLAAWPGAAAGDTAYNLVDGVPRTFSGTQLRHVYIDLDGATYCIVTWR
jgi:hypothetical protein